VTRRFNQVTGNFEEIPEAAPEVAVASGQAAEGPSAPAPVSEEAPPSSVDGATSDPEGIPSVLATPPTTETPSQAGSGSQLPKELRALAEHLLSLADGLETS
jgi:hypothetical protein